MNAPNSKKAEDEARKKFTPATQKERIWTGTLLIFLSIAVTASWFVIFQSVQSRADHEYKAAWTPKRGIELEPGPSSFEFDNQADQLVTRGPLDTSTKEELVKLIAKDGVAIFPPNPAGKSYWQALDRLAFDSTQSSDQILWFLLVLGGMSGLLGVQLRSLVNFLGVASFQNTLDISRWWPWYLVRPPAGFVFGLAAMLLLQVGFFQPETSVPDQVTWGIVLALLAGFGAGEFADRLRLLAKTLFGESATS